MFELWDRYDSLHDLWKLLIAIIVYTFVWFAVISDKRWMLVVFFIIFLSRCSYCLLMGVNKIRKK